MKADLFSLACPSRDILAIVGGKWAMLIVCVLADGPVRTGILRRRIQGVSQKMLTQTLRDLERHGILLRIDHAEVPPHVEYRLTAMGESLSALVREMESWVVRHYPKLSGAVSAFDARSLRARSKARRSAGAAVTNS
jgi:DNA-binding HxlR family transcriptional regulator